MGGLDEQIKEAPSYSSVRVLSLCRMLYPPNTDTLNITKFRKDGGAEGMRERREKKKGRNYYVPSFHR